MRGWEKVTSTDLAKLGRQPVTDLTLPQRRSKYRNVRVEVDGIMFDSKREAEHWLSLKAREQAGEIRDLKRQVRYNLICPNPERLIHYTVSEYVADFDYYVVATGEHIVSDAKGHRTREYLLKRKWLELQEGIAIVEV